MPTQIKKLPGAADGYEVVNPESGAIHAKKTSKAKAKAQSKILEAAAAAKEEPLVAKAEAAPEIKGEGKKAHKWLDHCKAFAAKEGITYSAALKHADLKKDYKPVEKASRSPRAKKAVAMEGAGVIDQVPDQAVLAIAANTHQLSPNVLEPQLESLASAKKARKPRARKTAAV
jgi:hypothetical protein